MIGYLEGIVVALRDDHCVINVSGTGYRVSTKKAVLGKLPFGRSASLWIYTAVRENAIDLYGFEDEHELSLFELLLTVSGIGPKSALNVLDVAGVEALQNAIAHEQSSYLTQVSGIGKKTAERIIIELKGKTFPHTTNDASFQHDAEALEALMALGYSAHEAREALHTIPSSVHGTNDRLRAALQYMHTRV